MGIFSPKNTSYLVHYKNVAQTIVDSSKLLTKMVTLEDVSAYHEIAKEMFDLEERGDAQKSEVVKWINNTFVTPFDRDDMYILASRLDDVIDSFHEVIDTMDVYEINELSRHAIKQTEIIEDLAIRTFAVVSGLTDVRSQEENIEEIKELTISARKAHRKMLAKMIKEGNDTLEIIKTKALADALQESANVFRSVASIINTISIKEN
ncbi:MAG: DUF47 family protein [Lactobacillales bacterium]|jgi:uncharacterized protein Yka (UPF0111/DUF47 family)|nr:DUF47 family protein [Lactobacillales bacterium]